MNQPQRSLSNLGMSKSQIIYLNRIEHPVRFIKERTKVDWISSWQDMRNSRGIIIQTSQSHLYKRNELQYSYYQQQPRDLNQSLVEERQRRNRLNSLVLEFLQLPTELQQQAFINAAIRIRQRRLQKGNKIRFSNQSGTKLHCPFWCLKRSDFRLSCLFEGKGENYEFVYDTIRN